MTQVTLNSGSVDSAGSLVLKTNGTTTAVTIDTAQNVGVGVVPSASSTKTIELPNGFSLTKGDITYGGYLAGNAYWNGTNWIYTTSRYATLYGQGAGSGQHQWFTSATGTAGNAISWTQAMTLDASGNLLVGTSSASSSYGKLTVFGTGITIAEDGNAKLQIGRYSSGSPYSYIKMSANSSGLKFTNPGDTADLMTLDSSGNLLVGDTTNTAGARIKAYSAGESLWATSTSTTAGNTVVFIENYQAAASNRYFLIGGNNAGDAVRIATNGNVTNTNNSYGAISDIKLKENITDATPKLSGLMQIRVVNYNLKDSPEHKQLGVIAQEVEQIFPSLIEESPDYENTTITDEDGNEQVKRSVTGATTKSVKYSVFVPMLIKALQEQQALITQLQADVAALKGQA